MNMYGQQAKNRNKIMNDQDSQIEKQKEQSVIFAQKVEESDYNQNHEDSNGFNNTFDSHFV